MKFGARNLHLKYKWLKQGRTASVPNRTCLEMWEVFADNMKYLFEWGLSERSRSKPLKNW